MDRFPRMPGLHTPSQSFSESSSAVPESAKQAFTEKKFKDEYEHAKSRLTDQKFEIKDYPDPLLPRSTPAEKYLPKGTTPELEARLQHVLAKVRENVRA